MEREKQRQMTMQQKQKKKNQLLQQHRTTKQTQMTELRKLLLKRSPKATPELPFGLSTLCQLVLALLLFCLFVDLSLLFFFYYSALKE